MPTIKNKTKQILCLTGKGGECVKISRDGVAIVSDALWANNSRQECVQAMLADRSVIVLNDAKPAPGTEPTATPSPVAVAPVVPEADDENDWSAMHWKKAKKMIDAEKDTTVLYALLEDEERPKIKAMLEARIGELEANEEAV